MAGSYRRLNVWRSAIAFASSVYAGTARFPKEELFGLTSQLRRAVVSVSANIAEGAGRGSKADFSRFIDIAIGSLNEVESLMEIAKEMNYVDSSFYYKFLEESDSLRMSLGAFRKHLKQSSKL